MKRPKLDWPGRNKADRAGRSGTEPAWVGMKDDHPEKVTWVDRSQSGWNSDPTPEEQAKLDAERLQRLTEEITLSAERARVREEKRARKQEQRKTLTLLAEERAREIAELPQKRADALDKLRQQISSTRQGRS